ncbi:hypothetical protein G6R31_12510 [Deinococcus wulumuqiensis R12]|nr:hypothetical protein G6R31_12510 [Deinococcus wulumuqiensis R12]
MMRSQVHLRLGVVVVLLVALSWPRDSGTVAREWPGPAGTRWAGLQLRGVQRYGGFFSNVGLTGQSLELRCRRFPALRIRTEYWPGPEWRGWAEWKTDRVTYQPGWKNATPRNEPVSLGAPWWLNLCPA